MSTEGGTMISIVFSFVIFFVTFFIERRLEARDEKLKFFAKYATPLQRQTCIVHDKLSFQRERKLEKGLAGKKSSVLYIDEKNCLDVHSNFLDIQKLVPEEAFVDWCFHFGYGLSSTCYDIACFFACVYLFQANNSISYIKKSKRVGIEELIAKIQGLFDQDATIWIAIQSDIAQTMIQNDSSGQVFFLSFSNFCLKAYHSEAFQKVFEFVIRLGDFGHRRQEISILIALYDLYFFLEEALYRYFGKTVVNEKIATTQIVQKKSDVECGNDLEDKQKQKTQSKALALEIYLKEKYLKPSVETPILNHLNVSSHLVEVDYLADTNAPKKYIPPDCAKSYRFKTLRDYEISISNIKNYLFPFSY